MEFQPTTQVQNLDHKQRGLICNHWLSNFVIHKSRQRPKQFAARLALHCDNKRTVRVQVTSALPERYCALNLGDVFTTMNRFSSTNLSRLPVYLPVYLTTFSWLANKPSWDYKMGLNWIELLSLHSDLEIERSKFSWSQIFIEPLSTCFALVLTAITWSELMRGKIETKTKHTATAVPAAAVAALITNKSIK